MKTYGDRILSTDLSVRTLKESYDFFGINPLHPVVQMIFDSEDFLTKEEKLSNLSKTRELSLKEHKEMLAFLGDF
jgi:hypothetical protein